jgi:ribosomal protein S12 methylthiotransferase
MLDGPSKESEFVWEARHEGMAPEIDGKIYVTDFGGDGETHAPQRGDIVTLEIIKAHDYDLEGRVVNVLRSADVAPVLASAAGEGSPFRIVT